MPKMILLSDAVNKLTKDVSIKYHRTRLKKSIRDRYKTAANKNGWIRTNKLSSSGNYEVLNDEFYTWFYNVFVELKPDSTKLIKWKRVTGTLNFKFRINHYKPIPEDFAKIEGVVDFIHMRENEANAEKEAELAKLRNHIKLLENNGK